MMTVLIGRTITEYRYSMDGTLVNFDAHDGFGDEITVNAQSIAYYKASSSDREYGCVLTFLGGHVLTITEPYEEVRRILRHT